MSFQINLHRKLSDQIKRKTDKLGNFKLKKNLKQKSARPGNQSDNQAKQKIFLCFLKNNAKINLALKHLSQILLPLKLGPVFQIKTFFFDGIKSFLVYRFIHVDCSSSCIGKTCRHFQTRFEEHVKKERSYTYT